MRTVTILLGTVVLGPLAGFSASQAIDTVPKESDATLAIAPQSVPLTDIDSPQYQNYPDHYPLVTRSGRFEIEELWKRRPARMRPYDPADFDVESRLTEAPSSEADLTDEGYGLSYDHDEKGDFGRLEDVATPQSGNAVVPDQGRSRPG